MMQLMLELRDKELLSRQQMAWFQSPQQAEELYDLKNDPFELHNLAGNSEYENTLVELRNALNNWVESSADLGRIPERELLTRWLSEGVQRELPTPELLIKGDSIWLECAIHDATIIWKTESEPDWKIYSGPVENPGSFQARAERIGYRPSQLLSYSAD